MGVVWASKAWAYGKEKIRGAEINLPDFFGFCQTTPEKFFVEQINFGDLPPHRQKNFGQCAILGVQKFFSDVQIFSEHQTPFPYITKLTTK